MSALQSSGAITLAQVQTEFGGSNPISMSEYYRGGSYVPSHGGTTGIPSSGQISMSQFYGKQDENPQPTSWSATLGTGTTSLIGSTSYGYSTYIFTYGSMSDITPTVGTQLNGSSSSTAGCTIVYLAWSYDTKSNLASFGIYISGKALTSAAFSRISWGSFQNYYSSSANFNSTHMGGGNYLNTWTWSLTYSSGYSPKSGNNTVILYQ